LDASRGGSIGGVLPWIALGAGAVAGWTARVVLQRLRAPVWVTAGLCETAVASIWLVLATGPLPGWWLPVPAALCWLTVVLGASDLRHRRLPNAVTLPAYPAAALLLGAAALAGPGPALAVRAALGGLLLGLVHAAVQVVAPTQLGVGDVKLAAPLGAVLAAVSWSALLLGMVVAALITAVLAPILSRRKAAAAGVGESPVLFSAPHGVGMLTAALLVAMFPATTALGP
jgi:leader peptidase (prepilin peptidase) / N-methyltransferase